MASNEKTIEELTAEVADLIKQTEELGTAIEYALDHQLQKGGRRLVKVADAGDRGVALYALPAPYYEQAAENESTAALRRELAEAEAALESADTWVERTRTEQRIASLRRELGLSAFDRPVAPVTVVAVKRVPTAEMEFMEPNTASQTDREAIRLQVERFERRTRS